MYEIYKAEFLRYRTWALLVLLAQLSIALFLGRLGPLLEVGGTVRAISYLVIVIGSLGFGCLQMYLHRRKNDWTYLIQRPLAPYKIYLALAAAAISCIALALPAGWLIMVSGLDLFTNGVVDSRHYLHALFGCAAGVAAYLIGSLIMLSASRGAFLLIGLLALVVTDISDNTPLALLIALVLIAGLLYLNARSFKSDLSTHLQAKHAIVLMSVPMQFGIAFMLLLSTTVFYHIPRFVIGNHPDNNPVVGAYKYLWNLDEAGQVEYLLRDSDLPNKASLIRQAEIADYELLHSRPERFARRGQLHFLDEQNGITHADTNTHWAFSHDSMLLQGNSRATGEIIGYVGQNGFIDADAEPVAADRFGQVPYLIGDRYLQTLHALYEVDFSERLLTVKFALDGDDSFRKRPDFTDHFVAITSNKYLYLFDPEDFREEQETAIPDYAIPHPDMFSVGSHIGLYRMVDGFLLAYHDREYLAFNTPGAEIVYARLDGPVESLHVATFPVRAHPAPMQHFDYVVSPVLNVTRHAIFRAIDPTNTFFRSLRESAEMRMPKSVNVTALVFALCAVVGVALLARRIHLERSKTLLWLSMAVLFGLPALISFCLMNPLRRDEA